MRHPVQKPDYRNNGNYQFITGYTGGGNPMCAHVSKEEIEQRLTEKLGAGVLVDDGENLWWKTNVVFKVGDKVRLENNYGVVPAGATGTIESMIGQCNAVVFLDGNYPELKIIGPNRLLWSDTVSFNIQPQLNKDLELCNAGV